MKEKPRNSLDIFCHLQRVYEVKLIVKQKYNFHINHDGQEQ